MIPKHKKIPIFVKLAPEIGEDTLSAIIFALEEAKVDGFVLTNTVGGTYKVNGNDLPGGFSGQILSTLGLKRLIEGRSHTQLPILSVGGIMSVEQAMERLSNGANAIQLYTGWIYEGPFFAKKILAAWKGRA